MPNFDFLFGEAWTNEVQVAVLELSKTFFKSKEHVRPLRSVSAFVGVLIFTTLAEIANLLDLAAPRQPRARFGAR